MKILTRALLATAVWAATFCAHAADPRLTIAELNSRLSKIGAPHIEGADSVAGKAVPALYFGNRKINGNYDLVDSVRKDLGAVATVFVKDGDQFIRISTNVMTPEGRRAVGTTLARNKAYEAISHNQSFCGVIDVLGTSFNSCYNPISDASGHLIAVSFVGHKQ